MRPIRQMPHRQAAPHRRDGSTRHCLNTTSRCAFAGPAPPVALHRGKRAGRECALGRRSPVRQMQCHILWPLPYARGAMGSLVWVKCGDGNARPQPKGKGRGERGAHCKGAETPAVYTRPRMESHVRDPGQAAPCRPAETATRPMARAARSGNGASLPRPDRAAFGFGPSCCLSRSWLSATPPTEPMELISRLQ